VLALLYLVVAAASHLAPFPATHPTTTTTASTTTSTTTPPPPAYTWTFPAQNAILYAQGAPTSSFTDLDNWWTAHSAPA
jgi:hypothetical protein